MSPTPTPPGPGELEARLRAEPLLPLPPAFVERTIQGLPPRVGRARRLAALARFAAAVLLAFGAWFAATGGLPRAAAAAAPPALDRVLEPARDLLPAALTASGGWTTGAPVAGLAAGVEPSVAGAAGLLLLALGLFAARRLVRGPRLPEPP
ncbi:MAG: hypothetical protein ACC662_00870, partial [Planctomycetota bacterium]